MEHSCLLLAHLQIASPFHLHFGQQVLYHGQLLMHIWSLTLFTILLGSPRVTWIHVQFFQFVILPYLTLRNFGRQKAAPPKQMAQLTMRVATRLQVRFHAMGWSDFETNQFLPWLLSSIFTHRFLFEVLTKRFTFIQVLLVAQLQLFLEAHRLELPLSGMALEVQALQANDICLFKRQMPRPVWLELHQLSVLRPSDHLIAQKIRFWP